MILTPEKLKFFADLIERKVGIVYGDTNYYQLEHRLNDIATIIGLEDANALYQKALGGLDAPTMALLLDLATNNETSFFRDPHVFAGLKHLVVPKLKEARPGMKTVSIWCAATSTGQEPYSIAMTFNSARTTDPDFPECTILCTDLSERVLKRAEAGVYSHLEVQRGLGAREMIQNFTKPSENEWEVKPELKRGMRFKQLNLLEEWGIHETFDLIFCRNVLIYQSVENKTKVVNRLRDRLATGGFLVMGASESMLGISEDFAQEQYQNAIYYQKK